eukprot:2281888-Pyramimonas_sp.AAC.1
MPIASFELLTRGLKKQGTLGITPFKTPWAEPSNSVSGASCNLWADTQQYTTCLLYTSDAADDTPCVDL